MVQAIQSEQTEHPLEGILAQLVSEEIECDIEDARKMLEEQPDLGVETARIAVAMGKFDESTALKEFAQDYVNFADLTGNPLTVGEYQEAQSSSQQDTEIIKPADPQIADYEPPKTTMSFA